MNPKERSQQRSSSMVDLGEDETPEGRYIPYSGGSMGWFENQGVLRSERSNNYRYREAMESEHVRAALFNRWGQVTDQRSARRIASENSVNLLMSDNAVPETAFELTTEDGVLSGVTKDISHYGMRMQFDTPLELTKGDPVRVQLLGRTTSDAVLDLSATVMWVKREMVTRPIWFVGVAFRDLAAETDRLFAEFLGR